MADATTGIVLPAPFLFGVIQEEVMAIGGSNNKSSALVVGTRCADVVGRPEEHVSTGAPWQVYACVKCEMEIWLSAISRKAVSERGLRLVPMCEPCAGIKGGMKGG